MELLTTGLEQAKATVAVHPVAVKSALNQTVPFIYPPDASNYVWSEEMSTDLVSWQTIQICVPGAPSGALSVKITLPQAFYRLRGTSTN